MTIPVVKQVHKPVPNPTQGNAGFNSNAQSLVDSLPDTVDTMNEAVAFVNLKAVEANQSYLDANAQILAVTNAGANQVNLAANQVALATEQKNQAILAKDDAEIARNIALAVSNMQEETWDELVGALPIWSAVFHNSKIWINKIAIADITTAEPTVANSTWIDYFDEISAGEVVSGPTDIADAKLPNVAWMKSRGLGSGNLLDGVSLNQDFGNGFKFFYLNNVSDGPTPAFYGFGIYTGLTTFGHSAMEVISRENGKKYWRVLNTSVYGPWFGVDTNNLVIPANRGGTGETTLEAARVAMGAAKAGSIHLSGLQMTGLRILGKDDSGTGDVDYLTAAEVRAFIAAAQSGLVTNSGLTMATARFLARTASGTGPVQELNAASMLVALGITSNYVGFGTNDWVNIGSGITYFKFGTYVVLVVDIVNVNGSSNTNAVSHTGIVPAAYRPANNQLKNLLVSGIGMMPFNVQVSLSTAGTTVITRTDATTTQGRGQVIFAYAA